MRKLALVVSAGLLAVPGAALAQAAPADAPRAARPDLTRSEAQARAVAAFTRMDANKDGTLDQADRAARRAALFDRIDTDRDGTISRAEFEAMNTGRESRKPRAGAKRGGAQLMAMRRSAEPVSQQAFVDRALAIFDRVDADRNGTVTQAERRAAREAMRQRWQDRRPARQQG